MCTTLVLFLLLMTAMPLTGWSQREPIFGRTMIFTQAQLKYSLQHGSYFTHWVDWPLGMDSSLKEDGVAYRGLQYPDYQKIQDNVKLYDLDGIIFWQAHVRFGWCSDIIGFTRRSQRQDFQLIPNLSSTFDPDLDGPPILQSPDFLRRDGQVVAILYGGGKPERVQALREKFPVAFCIWAKVVSPGSTFTRSTAGSRCPWRKSPPSKRPFASSCVGMTALAGMTCASGPNSNTGRNASRLNTTAK
jgi:hypothetical protein